ncbi:MAG: response regulator [Polyangiaceae bacterium]|nr:response regulator [Polyangiaceae bacterium]
MLVALVFAGDLAVPLGFAVGVLYLPSAAALLPSRVAWHAPAHAAVCTVATILDIVLGAGGVPAETALFNRGVTVLGIWLFALLLRHHCLSQREFERQQRVFHRALDAAPDGMLLVDRAGKVLYGNAAAEQMFGRPLEGRDTTELCRPVAAGDSLAAHRGSRRDGTEFPLECRAASLDHDEPGQVVVLRDLTERHRYEERLRATQRMEAVGKLAGGIAHDFNNVLAVIISYTEFVHEAAPPGSALAADLDEIRAAANRAADLVHQLLAFSRRQVIAPMRVDLDELLGNLRKMLARLLGEDMQIETVRGEGLWLVEVDPCQLEQVLLNLVVNARDAMPRGGKVTIETENVQLDEAYAREHPDVTSGDYVRLAVSDTGEGMSEAVRARIFEPFFTTKPVGRGSGLGLSTVYGIVRQCRGHIWVYSEPGQGTTFKIYLPRALGDAQPLPARRPSARPLGGTERLLVVEDEAPVRAVMVRTLRAGGYTVFEASNGVEALLKLKTLDERVDLLITDVVMPQMGGRELAVKVAEEQPALRVLYLSGYTENAIVHHGVLDAGLVFLPKPFTPDGLLRRVRDVLSAPPG